MQTTGRPPAPVAVPEDALWAPLVQNATTYPADAGAPLRREPEREDAGEAREEQDGPREEHEPPRPSQEEDELDDY